MTLVHNNSMDSVPLIHPHKLAKDLHSRQEYVLLDCRPVLAYNSCHISGAVNVNFTGNDTAYRYDNRTLFYIYSPAISMYVLIK